MRDLSIIEKTFDNNDISDELLNNTYFGSIVKLYSNKNNNLEQLKIINTKNKLTVADIYEIITSKYPVYVSQLIVESKVIKKLEDPKNLTKILNIINNCEKDYQAFGIVFFITQIGNIELDYMLKTCNILSTINTIPRMYYSLKIAILSNNYTSDKKMLELTKIIANSLTDNHAKYAYNVGKKHLKESKNPIRPTYKASKIKNLELKNNPNNYIYN